LPSQIPLRVRRADPTTFYLPRIPRARSRRGHDAGLIHHAHVHAQKKSICHEARAYHHDCSSHSLLVLKREVIRSAAIAAPKPLSILTTDTPDAQPVSMENSAVNPDKAAPYPTDAGTAITGQRTKPPSTEGKAPSIPATQIIAGARSRTGI